MRRAEAPGEAIVNPSRYADPVRTPRQQDAERCAAIREIVRPVDRIDHPALPGQPFEQRGIGMRRFLADDRERCVERREALAQHQLGFAVCHGHQIVMGLFDDLGA